MKAYNYSPFREFTYAVEARPDPMRPGNYLLPANATFLPPPTLAEGYTAIFNGAGWDVFEDHRGKVVYRKGNGLAEEVNRLGPIPPEYTLDPCPDPATYQWDFTKNVWVVNPDALLAKDRKTRNGLLALCDWTQASDSPLSEAKKAEWAAYRQELRDFTVNWTPGKAFPIPPKE